MEVKFYLRGKNFVKDVCDTDEYGRSGYQWRNILGVVADCGRDFPKVKHIDSAIAFTKDEIEEAEADGEDTKSLDETLTMLERVLEDGKSYMVVLSNGDESLWDEESCWIEAEDEEDACKKALLELGYGEGQVIYIKDVFGNFVYGEDK